MRAILGGKAVNPNRKSDVPYFLGMDRSIAMQSSLQALRDIEQMDGACSGSRQKKTKKPVVAKKRAERSSPEHAEWKRRVQATGVFL